MVFGDSSHPSRRLIALLLAVTLVPLGVLLWGTEGISRRRGWCRTFGASRIHPDGKRIVYQTSMNAMEVWTLENFLPANAAPK